MRQCSLVLVLILAISAWPSRSFAQAAGSVEGFGGVSFSTGDETFAPNLGGTVSFALTPNLHIVGEGGHLLGRPTGLRGRA